MEKELQKKPSQTDKEKYKIVGYLVRRPISKGAYDEFRQKIIKSLMPKKYDVLGVFDSVHEGSFQTMYIVDQFDETGALISIHESFVKKDSFVDQYPGLYSDFGEELSTDFIRIR